MAVSVYLQVTSTVDPCCARRDPPPYRSRTWYTTSIVHPTNVRLYVIIRWTFGRLSAVGRGRSRSVAVGRGRSRSVVLQWNLPQLTVAVRAQTARWLIRDLTAPVVFRSRQRSCKLVTRLDCCLILRSTTEAGSDYSMYHVQPDHKHS